MAKSKAKSHSKPRSTTKFIMYLMMSIMVIIVAFSIFMTWVLKDSMILITLIPCVFVETATCTAFYFFRRKVEAIINYKLQYGEEFIEHTLDDL